jgi:hypothetical protein
LWGQIGNPKKNPENPNKNFFLFGLKKNKKKVFVFLDCRRDCDLKNLRNPNKKPGNLNRKFNLYFLNKTREFKQKTGNPNKKAGNLNIKILYSYTGRKKKRF